MLDILSNILQASPVVSQLREQMSRGYSNIKKQGLDLQGKFYI